MIPMFLIIGIWGGKRRVYHHLNSSFIRFRLCPRWWRCFMYGGKAQQTFSLSRIRV